MLTKSKRSSAVPKIEFTAPVDVSGFDEAMLARCLFQLERVEQQAASLRLRITQRSAELHRAGSRERPEDLLTRSGLTPSHDVKQTIKTAKAVAASPDLAANLDLSLIHI